MPTQHGFEQGVLRGPAGRFELDMLTALKERPDLLQALGLGLLHDESHRPQLAPSGARLPAQLPPSAFLCWNGPWLQARPVLETTPGPACGRAGLAH